MTPLSHKWLGEGKSALWRNDKVVEEPGHITDLLAREAVEWLGKDSPAAVLSLSGVHLPACSLE